MMMKKERKKNGIERGKGIDGMGGGLEMEEKEEKRRNW